jgi:hypothetical protein
MPQTNHPTDQLTRLVLALTFLVTLAPSPLAPGLWYTLPLTGTGSGFTQTVSVRLLVGGARVYLPVTLT